MCNVIFIFGPSCSGKSSLGQALQQSLGSKWTYIDRDNLIEQNLSPESAADAMLDTKIQSIGQNIIIDAQVPWRKKKHGEFYFLLLPPLQVLLHRDAERTLKLQRSPIRAGHARTYVIETYEILNKTHKTVFDHCFNSSQYTIDTGVETIRLIAKLN